MDIRSTGKTFVDKYRDLVIEMFKKNDKLRRAEVYKKFSEVCCTIHSGVEIYNDCVVDCS